MASATVTVVRPYEASIRERVFPTLQAAGLTIDRTRIIPTRMTDDEVMIQLRSRSHDVLLIPFHGHTDEASKIVNGLTLAKRIEEELPRLARCPIIMPVDRHSAALVETILKGEWIGKRLRERTFLLAEDELGKAGLERRIAQHISRFLSRRRRRG